MSSLSRVAHDLAATASLPSSSRAQTATSAPGGDAQPFAALLDASSASTPANPPAQPAPPTLNNRPADPQPPQHGPSSAAPPAGGPGGLGGKSGKGLAAPPSTGNTTGQGNSNSTGLADAANSTLAAETPPPVAAAGTPTDPPPANAAADAPQDSASAATDANAGVPNGTGPLDQAEGTDPAGAEPALAAGKHAKSDEDDDPPDETSATADGTGNAGLRASPAAVAAPIAVAASDNAASDSGPAVRNAVSVAAIGQTARARGIQESSSGAAVQATGQAPQQTAPTKAAAGDLTPAKPSAAGNADNAPSAAASGTASDPSTPATGAPAANSAGAPPAPGQAGSPPAFTSDGSSHGQTALSSPNAPSESSNPQNATAALQALNANLPTAGTATGGPQHATAAAATSANSATTATVPVAGLPIFIAARAQAGVNQFDIRLDPPELGRIEVKLGVDSSGQITSHVTVDRPETLSLLQSQQPQLERALEQAGLRTADNGLQFSLRDQSFSGGNNGSGSQTTPTPQLVVPDADLTPVDVSQIYSRWGIGSGVDIRV